LNKKLFILFWPNFIIVKDLQSLILFMDFGKCPISIDYEKEIKLFK